MPAIGCHFFVLWSLTSDAYCHDKECEEDETYHPFKFARSSPHEGLLWCAWDSAGFAASLVPAPCCYVDSFHNWPSLELVILVEY